MSNHFSYFRFISVFFLTLATAIPLRAQQLSDSVFPFLELNENARSAALGGHHAAFLNADFSLFALNPAYLESDKEYTFQASYMNHIDDINFGTFSTGYSIEDVGNFGVSVRFLNYGDLTRFDEFGNDLGSLSANDLALTVGWSSRLASRLTYGLAVTGIYSSLGEFTSTGVSFSGGMLYQFEETETALGLTLTNAGTQLSTFNGRQERLPLNIGLGVVHKVENVPFRLHYTLNNLHDWELSTANDTGNDVDFMEELLRHSLFGIEILFSRVVKGRVGYDHFLHEQTKTGKRIDGAGVSAGFGIKLNKVELDVARTSFSDLGNLIQLSAKVVI